jgi:hypothetical protein
VSGIRRRLESLEARAPAPAERSPEEEVRTREHLRKSWDLQVEFVAWALIGGYEPTVGVDRDGTFYTLDGRFALDRERMDLQALMGPQTRRIEEAVPTERWRKFLSADASASDLLEDLLARAEGADVPEGYELPMEDWHAQAEIRERIGDPHGVGGPVFGDAEEKEATRCLMWAFINDPEAMRLLAEVLRRRDIFAVGEGEARDAP